MVRETFSASANVIQPSCYREGRHGQVLLPARDAWLSFNGRDADATEHRALRRGAFSRRVRFPQTRLKPPLLAGAIVLFLMAISKHCLAADNAPAEPPS